MVSLKRCELYFDDSVWSSLRAMFVSEAIEPLTDSCDTGAMATGAPGLPAEFRWRGEVLRIEEVLRAWKDTGPCTHGSSESYVRKHWFEVRTDSGQVARLYFERQPRRGGKGTRWQLYQIEDAG